MIENNTRVILNNDDTSKQQWELFWESTTRIDHGNGICKGKEVRFIRITQDGLTRGSTMISAEFQESHAPVQHEQLSVQRRVEIEVFLQQLSGIVGRYRLSEFVNDEGSHSEHITVTVGGVTQKIHYCQGRTIRNVLLLLRNFTSSLFHNCESKVISLLVKDEL